MKITKVDPAKYSVRPEGEFNPKLLLDAIEGCADGTQIVFEAGNYYFPNPENAVELKNIKKNILFRAEKGARFIGGRPVFGAAPVPREAKDRFFPEARDKVLCADLKASGIEDAGDFASRGFGREVSPSHSEVFIDGRALNLSRYPKSGYLKIAGYVEEDVNEWSQKVGRLEKGFLYECDRPEKWADSDDMLTFGYWSWDWANTCEKIAKLDRQAGIITTEAPYGIYAFKPGQRFNFFNILEEVTECGDYYIDRKNLVLYFIPFERGNTPVEIGEILVSTQKKPLWSIEGCENLCFEGFSIEATCGSGMTVSGSENIKITGCTFKNIGNYGATVRKCRNVAIENCDVHDCGDGGIGVSCGNRATLEAGNVKIHNNHIHRIAKWTRTYQTAVNASGVGIEVTNNLIHDCPHTGILFWGNEISIKNNEIYSALLETGDAGAVYTGRDFTYRGNTVSGNYIHHLGGVGMGTMGIYNDDCVSGTLMEENIFFEVQRAVFLGGGRNFQVRGNLFVDCHPSVEIDGRGTSSHEIWRKMVDEYMRDRFYRIKENETADGETANAMLAPYISRYPELGEIDGFYKAGLPVPPSALIEKNVYCSKRKTEFTWDSEPGEFVISKNKSIGRECFEDYAIGLFYIKDGTDAELYGFGRLDIFKSGLDEGARKNNPPRILTALQYGGGELFYRYKNFSDICVEGAEVTLYASEADSEVVLGKFKVSIEAKGEGTVKIPFEVRANGKIWPAIDARADVAGIRPCRFNG